MSFRSLESNIGALLDLILTLTVRQITPIA